ncbi:MAG: glycosyltransferase WbuB [Deltaproteobacteria bacterium HGW-Deltaproteobacteria-3]|nr:MAG: glycosyltransferase WbuB [Deltaproteobacteria bacterium HGW-Deltaproteobacteria-3]
MRILLLMQWFDPEPQIKGLVFAKKFRDLGHEVEVLTGFPNYPGGNIYPGYSVKFFQVEIMDGIRIIRVPLYPSHDTSAFRRVLNYISFGITSCLAGFLVANRKDVIYACGPPVTVGVSAALISMFRRVPFVYDIQDLWPDSLGSTGMFRNSYGVKVVASVCKWVYKRAAHITVQSLGVKDSLVARSVDEEKISVVFNWCDEFSIGARLTDVTEPDQQNSGDQSHSTFDVLFAGNMGKAQEMDAVLEAARLLKDENPTIRLLLIGGGVEVPRLQQIIKDKLITNVTFLPRVPMSEVGAVFARADALLVHLKDDPLFKITIPAKTQAYLAAGKPIIMAVAGDATELVLESEAGVCAQPGNARSIADAIRQLALTAPEDLRRMGEKGRIFYWEKMSLDAGARKFLDIFQRIHDKNESV